MNLIYFFIIFFSYCSVDEVFLGIYPHTNPPTCDKKDYMYAYKIGELRGTCENTTIAQQEYYVRSICNENSEVYRLDFFENNRCFGESLFHASIPIYIKCTHVEESNIFDVRGECIFKKPEHQVHIRFFLNDNCNSQDLSMDVFFHPMTCINTGEIPYSSSSFVCHNDTTVTVSIFSDDKCKKHQGGRTMKKGQCYASGKNGFPSFDDFIDKKMFFPLGGEKLFLRNDQPLSLMMVEPCTV